jgi:hypothetical protein
MKRKTFGWTAGIFVVLGLAVGVGALAQTPRYLKLRGTLSDYTTQGNPATVAGPWEVRGTWSLLVRGESGKADFSAALTMVHSDQGVIKSGAGDFDMGKGRNPHTHHINLVDGDVTAIPGGFRVTGGKVTITANGNNPPPFGAASGLQIDVVGGNTVDPSNISVLFLDDAAGHFGALPLHGVVRSTDKDNLIAQ